MARLDRGTRARELARLIGGSSVTEAILSSAGELLDQAEQYKEKQKQKQKAAPKGPAG